jgi:aromatic ring-opening dioxygenase catalytic subunit (LigB family)
MDNQDFKDILKTISNYIESIQKLIEKGSLFHASFELGQIHNFIDLQLQDEDECEEDEIKRNAKEFNEKLIELLEQSNKDLNNGCENRKANEENSINC